MEQEERAQIVVRVPEPLAREFKAACALTGTSLQFVLEQAIKKYVEEKKKNPV